MPDTREQLTKAGDEYKAVRASLAQARDQLQPLMVSALREGMAQKDVMELSGYTRESVRSLARANGITEDGRQRRPS